MRCAVTYSRTAGSFPASANVGGRRTFREHTKSVHRRVPTVSPLRPAAPPRRAAYRETSSVATTSSHHAHRPLLRRRVAPGEGARSSRVTGLSSTQRATYAARGALRSRQPR